jgi:hypothetical protein
MSTRAYQFDFLLSGIWDPATAAPLNGGSVEFYEVGTTTPKNVWTEEAKTNAYTSYTLDAAGMAELFGDGNYKVILKNAAGSVKYTFDLVKTQSNEYIRRTISGTTGEVTPEDDAIMCNSGANNIAITLQTVQNYNRPIAFKKTSANNTVTVTPYGSETIDGEANRTMTANNTTFSLIPDKDAGMWRVSNHIAIGLVDLTASIDEINTACDGITVPAEDLNQLDGVEVGGTASGDIVTLDDTQSLSSKTFTDRPVLSGGGINDGTQNIDFPTNGMSAAKFMLGNSNTIAWFYLNTAPPGWKVLATGADTVLGVSGGAGDYNVNGGNPDSSATWQREDHTLSTAEVPELSAEVDLAAGSGGSAAGLNYTLSGNVDPGWDPNYVRLSTNGGGGAHNHGSTWRPAASVGKLFQLDTA